MTWFEYDGGEYPAVSWHGKVGETSGRRHPFDYRDRRFHITLVKIADSENLDNMEEAVAYRHILYFDQEGHGF